MSNRYHGYDSGSSRSTRDDSRTYKSRPEDRDRHYKRTRSRSPRGYDHETKQNRRRTRSRSPCARSSPDTSDKWSRKSGEEDYKDRRRGKSPRDRDNSDEEVPAPPPPPRITKVSIGFVKPKGTIKMNIGGPAKSTVVAKRTVASVFNQDDDDDEPEEMPAEARMRMRNIGRETPTSAGPNSFGKTKQGFCDAKKVFEKNLKQALDEAEKPSQLPKFPQTIYKIKGP